MIKVNYFKNPIAFAVGFLLLLLTACQSEKTPAETTLAFWSAMSQDQLETAQKYSTLQSQKLLNSSGLPQSFKGATFDFGTIVIDGNLASVETFIISNSNKKPALTFATYLIKQENNWKVDFQRSSSHFSNNQLFNDFFNSLNTLGGTLNEQLKKQIPLIENGIESLGQELKAGNRCFW